MAKITSIRVLLTLAVHNQWKLVKLDINNSFLNEELEEEVYMKHPLGYPAADKNHVRKLTKFLYDLRHESRQWFAKFSLTILSHEFQQSFVDSSLFTRGLGTNFVALLVNVDDIILAGPDATEIERVQQLT